MSDDLERRIRLLEQVQEAAWTLGYDENDLLPDGTFESFDDINSVEDALEALRTEADDG